MEELKEKYSQGLIKRVSFVAKKETDFLIEKIELDLEKLFKAKIESINKRIGLL